MEPKLENYTNHDQMIGQLRRLKELMSIDVNNNPNKCNQGLIECIDWIGSDQERLAAVVTAMQWLMAQNEELYQTAIRNIALSRAINMILSRAESID